MENLFAQHIRIRQATTAHALDATQFPGLIIDAGEAGYYFADDAHIPFRPTPHFAHWCPASGQSHLLIIEAGKKPHLLRYLPEDIWHDPIPMEPNFWYSQFEITHYTESEDIWKEATNYQGFAYIGPHEAKARDVGLRLDIKELEHRLNWERAIKSDYEIQCLDDANKKAAPGHIAARKAFAAGGSELDIFYAYLQAVESTELGLPYGSIICLNEKSAVLHYQHKRHNLSGHTFLIDAGAKVLGYASDITRTYALKNKSHPVFQDILASMDTLQQDLAAQVRAGCDFTKLHDSCVLKTGEILLRHKVLKDLTPEGTIETGLTRKFFPHGLGHMLGIQVHDVGGRQIDAMGTPLQSDPNHKTLRTTRILRENEVVTIEPGLYFIPINLRKVQKEPEQKYVNWDLVEALIPCGGIRIEDNVVALASKGLNLTRKHLGNDHLV